eukprot:4246141-Pyramimonas_sp.AAC.2
MVTKGFQQTFTGKTGGTAQMRVRFEKPMPSAQELRQRIQGLHDKKGPQVVIQLLEQQRLDMKGKKENFKKPPSTVWWGDSMGGNSTNFYIKLNIPTRPGGPKAAPTEASIHYMESTKVVTVHTHKPTL